MESDEQRSAAQSTERGAEAIGWERRQRHSRGVTHHNSELMQTLWVPLFNVAPVGCLSLLPLFLRDPFVFCLFPLSFWPAPEKKRSVKLQQHRPHTPTPTPITRTHTHIALPSAAHCTERIPLRDRQQLTSAH